MILDVWIGWGPTLFSSFIYCGTHIVAVLSEVICIPSVLSARLINRLCSQTFINLRLPELSYVVMRSIQRVLHDKFISLILCLSKHASILIGIKTPCLSGRNANSTPPTQALIYINFIPVIEVTLESSVTCLAHWLLLVHHRWENSHTATSNWTKHPSGALRQRSTLI